MHFFFEKDIRDGYDPKIYKIHHSTHYRPTTSTKIYGSNQPNAVLFFFVFMFMFFVYLYSYLSKSICLIFVCVCRQCQFICLRPFHSLCVSVCRSGSMSKKVFFSSSTQMCINIWLSIWTPLPVVIKKIDFQTTTTTMMWRR